MFDSHYIELINMQHAPYETRPLPSHQTWLCQGCQVEISATVRIIYILSLIFQLKLKYQRQ